MTLRKAHYDLEEAVEAGETEPRSADDVEVGSDDSADHPEAGESDATLTFTAFSDD